MAASVARGKAVNAQKIMVEGTRSRNQWTREELLSFKPRETFEETALDDGEDYESAGSDSDGTPERSTVSIDRSRQQFTQEQLLGVGSGRQWTREQLLSFAPREEEDEEERGTSSDCEGDGEGSESDGSDIEEDSERAPGSVNRSEEQLSRAQSFSTRSGKQWTREQLLSFAPKEE